MNEHFTCDDDLDRILLQYDDDLTKLITEEVLTKLLTTSPIYGRTFRNQELFKRLDLLKTVVDHALRKQTIKGLEQTLQTKHQLIETSIIAWLYEYNFIKEKTNNYYNALEQHYTTRLRSLYQELIAEIIYISDKEKWNQMPVDARKTL